MAIRKVKGEFLAECEDCGTEHAGGVIEDFREFVQDLKDAGWKIKKDGDEWQHICPECNAEEDHEC